MIDEIEKINDRVAIGIGNNARQTMNRATAEEQTREQQIKRDFPNLFRIEDQEKLDRDNRTIDMNMPLTQQLSEAYNASDLKAYYSRDLDNFNMLLKRSNGSLKGISMAQVNAEARQVAIASTGSGSLFKNQ